LISSTKHFFDALRPHLPRAIQKSDKTKKTKQNKNLAAGRVSGTLTMLTNREHFSDWRELTNPSLIRS